MKNTWIRNSFLAVIACFGLFISSCGDSTNIQIPGIKGPFMTLVDGTIGLHLEFENIYTEGYGKFVIPQFEQSFVEIQGTETHGLSMTFKIDVGELLSFDDSILPPITIPFNRPIPGIPSGTLPGISFSLDQFENTTFYISPTMFGIFVPYQGIDMQGSIATFRYYVGEKAAGTISLVGADDQGNPSGVLLLLNMDAKTKKKLMKKIKN